jgi:Ca2+-transporting ATPase
MEAAAKMAQEGLRVLGVARGQCDGEELPRGQHDFAFKFVGLMGFTDPVRESAIQAVALCQHAGIRVAMITGDYPATACQIAQSVGISPCDDVVTGPELETLSDAELSERIKRVNIFARVVPEQKLRLVNAFKTNGEIVAMTGDGVNDAPALKSAYIGIAMGGRGTDVARESADLVLLDDDFSRIADAVRMGRRIFDNLRKAAAFIISVHVPIAGMSLIPVFFDWPLLLLPVHVMFLELLIDPACSIVFEMEREEDDIMDRKPRLLTEGMLSRSVLIFSLMQGLGVLAVILAVVTSARYRGMDDTEVRVLAFTTLTISNLMLILANRSWAHTFVHALRNVNSAFWYVTIGATVSLALVVNVPMLRDSIFHFAPLHAIDVALCVGLGLLSLAWFEALKALRRWRLKTA